MSHRVPGPTSCDRTSTSPRYTPAASNAASTEPVTCVCDGPTIMISTNCWVGSSPMLVATSSITEA